MGRYLNVGIIQMPVSTDINKNLNFLEKALDAIMLNPRKPDIVIGCESVAADIGESIPGPQSNKWADMAKKYNIYFIPGSMGEWDKELETNGPFYNTAPVYGPDGTLITKYRKMAPYRPLENGIPGNKYCVFEIPEMKTKIGLQICYDLNFPEISRNETLLGAEVLVKITLDPSELHRINYHLHYARAIENQAFMVSVNATGEYMSNLNCGGSMIIDPEGLLMWEAGENPCNVVITLDLDVATRARQYGSVYMDHYLQHLKDYNFPMPYANQIEKAPLYKTLKSNCHDVEEYIQAQEELNKL